MQCISRVAYSAAGHDARQHGCADRQEIYFVHISPVEAHLHTSMHEPNLLHALIYVSKGQVGDVSITCTKETRHVSCTSASISLSAHSDMPNFIEQVIKQISHSLVETQHRDALAYLHRHKHQLHSKVDSLHL